MEKGMKGTPMPSEHREKYQGKLGHTSNIKYSGEMSAPQDYDKANEGLANYVKKHKVKY
jgi:hypothetical protein